jgi:hypothetical protein
VEVTAGEREQVRLALLHPAEEQSLECPARASDSEAASENERARGSAFGRIHEPAANTVPDLDVMRKPSELIGIGVYAGIPEFAHQRFPVPRLRPLARLTSSGFVGSDHRRCGVLDLSRVVRSWIGALLLQPRSSSKTKRRPSASTAS